MQGPSILNQKDTSANYNLEPLNNGIDSQSLVFNNEVFSRTSKFYKHKDGKYEDKNAEVTVVCSNAIKQNEQIGVVKFNVSHYVGRGTVKDSLQFTKGNVQYLDFEITIESSSSMPTEADESDEEDSTKGKI